MSSLYGSIDRIRKIVVAARSGVTAVEYRLIAGLVAVALFASLNAVGKGLGNVLNTVDNKVGDAAGSP